MSPRQEIVYLAAVFMRLRMLRIQASLGTSSKPQAGGALAEMRKGLSGRECIFPLFPTPLPLLKRLVFFSVPDREFVSVTSSGRRELWREAKVWKSLYFDNLEIRFQAQ